MSSYSAYSSYGSSSSYSAYNSYGSSYSTYGSSYSAYSSDCDDDGHRRLSGSTDYGCGGSSSPLTLFEFAFHTKSAYVVYCFVAIILFTIVAELILEHIEEVVLDVYHKVLQKLYKELMLLGLISFMLFFLRSSDFFAELERAMHLGDGAATEIEHAFEFAHFAMFFVGCALVIQTSWSCYCNRRIKKSVWVSCNCGYIQDLKPTYEHVKDNAFFHLSSNFESIQLKLFNTCFVEVFELPENFSFQHYVCACLDRHTVAMVEVLPSSYFAVLVCVVVSEFVLRHQGPTGRAMFDPEMTIVVFFFLGLFLCLCYLVLHKMCFNALMNVLEVMFGCQYSSMVGDTLERVTRERKETSNTKTAQGSASTVDTLAAELRPYTDRAYFDGIEEEAAQNPETKQAFKNWAMRKSEAKQPSISLWGGTLRTSFSSKKSPKNTDMPQEECRSTLDQTPRNNASSEPPFRYAAELDPVEADKGERSPRRKFGGLRFPVGTTQQPVAGAPPLAHPRRGRTARRLALNAEMVRHAQAMKLALREGRLADADHAHGSFAQATLQHSKSLSFSTRSRSIGEEAATGNEEKGGVTGSALQARRRRNVRQFKSKSANFELPKELHPRPEKTRSVNFDLTPRPSRDDRQASAVVTAEGPPQKKNPPLDSKSKFRTWLSSIASDEVDSSAIGGRRLSSLDTQNGETLTSTLSRSTASVHGAAAKLQKKLQKKLRRIHHIKNKVDSSRWIADQIVDSIVLALPFESIQQLTRLIDAVRFLCNFYIAIYVTIFFYLWDPSHKWNGAVSTIHGVLAVLSVVPAALGNMVLERYVSVQFMLINTICTVDPLLMGETLQYMRETNKMMDHVAYKLLHRFTQLADPDDHEREDMEHIKELVHHQFQEWDELDKGHLDKEAFVHVMNDLGLRFTRQQMKTLFIIVDPDRNGRVIFAEFWGELEAPLAKALAKLREHFQFTDEDKGVPSAGLGEENTKNISSEEDEELQVTLGTLAPGDNEKHSNTNGMSATMRLFRTVSLRSNSSMEEAKCSDPIHFTQLDVLPGCDDLEGNPLCEDKTSPTEEAASNANPVAPASEIPRALTAGTVLIVNAATKRMLYAAAVEEGAHHKNCAKEYQEGFGAGPGDMDAALDNKWRLLPAPFEPYLAGVEASATYMLQNEDSRRRLYATPLPPENSASSWKTGVGAISATSFVVPADLAGMISRDGPSSDGNSSTDGGSDNASAAVPTEQQRWVVVPEEDGTYTIMNPGSMRALYAKPLHRGQAWDRGVGAVPMAALSAAGSEDEEPGGEGGGPLVTRDEAKWHLIPDAPDAPFVRTTLSNSGSGNEVLCTGEFKSLDEFFEKMENGL